MNALLRRLCHEQDGQALYLASALLVVLLGTAAISIDIGFAIHAQRELQASTDAAATAGALDLPNASAATTALCYSGVGTSGFGGRRTCPNGETLSAGLNAYPDLPGVTAINGTPLVTCVTASQLATLSITLGPTCTNAAGGNAVVVEQQVSVPTFFARVFGINSITLHANALVLEKGSQGAQPEPVNIMLIVDTTHSMSDADSTCTGTGVANPTREDCAKAGIRTMLTELEPCDPISGCGSFNGNGAATHPYQSVGLAIFPGLTNTSYDPDDYDCQTPTLSTSNGISLYAATTTQPPYYTVVPLSNNYLTSGSLNGASSNLVKAIDWANGNTCTSSKYGLQDPGGAGTYYAGVINEAQSAFSTMTGSKNVIILLSDGAANATQSDFVSGTSSTYYTNDCAQAVTAAQNATAAGTQVYAVAYGASTSHSNSCTTDTSTYTGCYTMSQIASNPTLFYSDDADDCQSTANPNLTTLTQIFQAIGYNFQSTRVLPFSFYNP
jgi:Flp pilus assembly protein TadG